MTVKKDKQKFNWLSSEIWYSQMVNISPIPMLLQRKIKSLIIPLIV